MDQKAQDIQAAFARLACEWAEASVTYRHRGTTRNGCDCTGLLIGIARELGYLKKYKLRRYAIDWNLHAGAGDYITTELIKFGSAIPNGRAAPGDIAVMTFGKCRAHVGVIVREDLLMVHSLKTNGRCKYDILKNSMWSRRWIETSCRRSSVISSRRQRSRTS